MYYVEWLSNTNTIRWWQIIFDCVIRSTDQMKSELDQLDCNIPKRFGSYVVLICK